MLPSWRAWTKQPVLRIAIANQLGRVGQPDETRVPGIQHSVNRALGGHFTMRVLRIDWQAYEPDVLDQSRVSQVFKGLDVEKIRQR